jgi:soluble lytic murein transglycosylase-like protein
MLPSVVCRRSAGVSTSASTPTRALEGAVRYLVTAERRFGRDDLAVVSYHMGIGNLEGVLRAYAAR